MGWRPTVRGSVMNPATTPTAVVRASPLWPSRSCYPGASRPMGYKTRKTKNRNDKFIVKRRNVK